MVRVEVPGVRVSSQRWLCLSAILVGAGSVFEGVASDWGVSAAVVPVFPW